MPASEGRLNYYRCKVVELRKFYKDRTPFAQKRSKGHAPSRWNKGTLISALRELDASATFDLFNNNVTQGAKRLPPEIRNLVYEKIQEVVHLRPPDPNRLWQDQKYPDLRNLSLTCRQAHAELSGIVHHLTQFRIGVCWLLGSGGAPAGKRYLHSIIEDSSSGISEHWENPDSPIVLYRNRSNVSGLKHIERCSVYISIPRMMDNFNSMPWQTQNEYLDERVERDIPIMSELFSEILGLSTRLKSIRIVLIPWQEFPEAARTRLHKLIMRAQSHVLGNTESISRLSTSDQYWFEWYPSLLRQN